ncbi:hypothetical protein [Candidatus Finniella inopinata]|uniref:Uncharacterized protein n=1 Tax=Candidatus Finniella inopinata TaxID=1696036 RepID=A0A4Q7DMQ1_9PROT|nr:hypothetical protein [Candidatus Finniella inopinata]RZI46096.1 hypothetical protein EQU50_03960 [Candidatus Finniella inopinata]
MSLYFRLIALAGIMLSVPGLCFACWKDADRDVTRLAPVQYKDFTFFPQTHQFDGSFWSEVNQMQIGLKIHMDNQITITNRSIVTSAECLLTNEAANCTMIREKIETLIKRQEELEEKFQQVSDIKLILNDLFYLITLNPDLFVVLGVGANSSGMGPDGPSFLLPPTFDQLIKKCKKSSLVAVNIDDFKKSLSA